MPNECRVSPCDIAWAIHVNDNPEVMQFLEDASLEVASESTDGAKYLGRCEDGATNCKWTLTFNGDICVGDQALCEADCQKQVTVSKYWKNDPTAQHFLSSAGKIISITVTDTASEEWVGFSLTIEGTGWDLNRTLCPPEMPAMTAESPAMSDLAEAA